MWILHLFISYKPGRFFKLALQYTPGLFTNCCKNILASMTLTCWFNHGLGCQINKLLCFGCNSALRAAIEIPTTLLYWYECPLSNHTKHRIYTLCVHPVFLINTSTSNTREYNILRWLQARGFGYWVHCGKNHIYTFSLIIARRWLLWLRFHTRSMKYIVPSDHMCQMDKKTIIKQKALIGGNF